MHDLIAGFSALLTVPTLLCIVVGLILGFVTGLIPGLGAASATAILLPFTLSMSVLNGLVLMVGIYAGTSYSMAVPAILLNMPTEPGAAVTALDGYPMGQKGEAARAIGIARFSSVTGGIIGIGVALIVLKPLAGIALKFGPGELFLLTIIGMTVVGGLVGNSPLKGLLAGGLGFLISGMGVNPLTSLPRFDFGQLALFDGVPFIPAVIGLYAVTEMVFLAARATPSAPLPLNGVQDAPKDNRKRSGLGLNEFGAGFHDVILRPRVAIQSGFIGLMLGLIPGMGHSIANFISYSICKRWSKTPETWGKGNPDGIIASEGCDNGVTGGAMIPMLALGIPSSGTTAVLVSALALHGVQPGPRVLSTHADLAYGVLIALFLANLLILPIGVGLSRPMIWFTQLKPQLLIPIVLAITMVGAYAFRQEAFDLRLFLVFGLLGIVMRLGDYPRVPLLIGLVLGPLCEQNLLLSLKIGNDSVSYFWSSSVGKGLVLLLLLIVGGLIWSSIRRSGGTPNSRQTTRPGSLVG